MVIIVMGLVHVGEAVLDGWYHVVLLIVLETLECVSKKLLTCECSPFSGIFNRNNLSTVSHVGLIFLPSALAFLDVLSNLVPISKIKNLVKAGE